MGRKGLGDYVKLIFNNSFSGLFERERERENMECWRRQKREMERERWGPIHRPYARSLTETKPITDLFSSI